MCKWEQVSKRKQKWSDPAACTSSSLPHKKASINPLWSIYFTPFSAKGSRKGLFNHVFRESQDCGRESDAKAPAKVCCQYNQQLGEGFFQRSHSFVGNLEYMIIDHPRDHCLHLFVHIWDLYSVLYTVYYTCIHKFFVHIQFYNGLYRYIIEFNNTTSRELMINPDNRAWLVVIVSHFHTSSNVARSRTARQLRFERAAQQLLSKATYPMWRWMIQLNRDTLSLMSVYSTSILTQNRTPWKIVNFYN